MAPDAAIGPAVKPRFWKSNFLLARRRDRSHRMAYSGRVRFGHAFQRVARIGVRMLFRNRSTLLVASHPALAAPRALTTMVPSLISFFCHLPMRHAFRISYFLRSRCLSVLPVRNSTFLYFASSRPGVCGRPYVGLRDAYLSAARGDNHNPTALSARVPLASMIRTFAEVTYPQPQHGHYWLRRRSRQRCHRNYLPRQSVQHFDSLSGSGPLCLPGFAPAFSISLLTPLDGSTIAIPIRARQRGITRVL